MSARDHRRYLLERVATWQLARLYRLAFKTRRAGRKAPGPLSPDQRRDGARRRLLTGIASGASQPEALPSCLPFELPPGNSKAEARATAVSGGRRRP